MLVLFLRPWRFARTFLSASSSALRPFTSPLLRNCSVSSFLRQGLCFSGSCALIFFSLALREASALAARLRSHSDSRTVALMPLTLTFFDAGGKSDLPSIHCASSSHMRGILGHKWDMEPYLSPMKHPTLEMRFASTIRGPSGVWATSHPMVKDSGAISLWALLHISTLFSQLGILMPPMGFFAPFEMTREGSRLESMSFMCFSSDPCHTTPVSE
mmetsp:Transcript_8705/g.22297  ORF Transcript_8705/g.22297 Transcript_8705/m.22297 type:complete len:215 (-) Transcript_8705:697-1341(-)